MLRHCGAGTGYDLGLYGNPESGTWRLFRPGGLLYGDVSEDVYKRQVHFRHADIQQDQIGDFPVQQAERLPSAVCHTYLVAEMCIRDRLRSTSGDEEYVQELGECIFREGKRIERLSEVMMDLIFVRRHTFDMEPCDAGELLRQSVMAYEPAAAKAGLRLETELPEKPVMIFGKDVYKRQDEFLYGGRHSGTAQCLYGYLG